MTRTVFIDKVIEELTEGGVIPASPNQSRINSIIDTALKYFYEHDDDSHEFQYMILDKSNVDTELFKEKRQILLPAIVHAVTAVRNLGTGFILGDYSNQGDFKVASWNLQMAIGGNSGMMLTMIANNYYNSYLQKFVMNEVQYDYSSYSNMLTIKGRDINKTMVMETSVLLPEEHMFNNERFFRYVIGKCKISYSNIIGFTSQKLIGGYNININDIKQEGKSMIDDVLKEQADQRISNFIDFMD